MPMICVRNRRLEQFLFYHGVSYVSMAKDEEGSTIWMYEDDDYTRHVVDEWKIVLARQAGALRVNQRGYRCASNRKGW